MGFLPLLPKLGYGTRVMDTYVPHGRDVSVGIV